MNPAVKNTGRPGEDKLIAEIMRLMALPPEELERRRKANPAPSRPWLNLPDEWHERWIANYKAAHPHHDPSNREHVYAYIDSHVAAMKAEGRRRTGLPSV